MSGADPEQLEKMREALDAKAKEPDTTHNEAEQEELHEAGRNPDVRDTRAKSSGHGKKTADKWNQ